MFRSFPYRHRINDAKNDAKTTRKRRADQLAANKGPTPRPPTINGNPSLRIRENKVGQRTQKQDGAQHTFFKIQWCGQLCPARNRRNIFMETS